MKKIILLSLVMIIALGALGIGYAAWTDTIAFSGSVTTGELDIELTGEYSGTYIYKAMIADGWGPEGTKIVLTKIGDFYYYPDGTLVGGQAIVDAFVTSSAWYGPIAYAQAGAGPSEDTVSVTFSDLYPCTDYVADFKVHVAGTVPVKMTFLPLPNETGYYTPTVGPDLDNTYIDPPANTIPALQLVYRLGPGEPWMDIEGDQFEPCQTFDVGIKIHIPQDNDYMNAEGTITGRLVAVQWDKYDEPMSEWDLD